MPEKHFHHIQMESIVVVALYQRVILIAYINMTVVKIIKNVH